MDREGMTRRHRIAEVELPAVRWGLYHYLSAACNGSIPEVFDVVQGFRLFYRVMNCRIGQPGYPGILDEEGKIDYGSIRSFLGWAEDVYPELKNGTILLDLLPEMEVIESG